MKYGIYLCDFVILCPIMSFRKLSFSNRNSINPLLLAVAIDNYSIMTTNYHVQCFFENILLNGTFVK